MKEPHSLIVVGAGIVGLAVAHTWQERHPGAAVCVIEKESGVGRHQTGNNSGVIHSPIYYPSGSAKARGASEGIELLAAFCERHGIERKKVGQVIVATEDWELPVLDKLLAQGRENGIPGLAMLDAAGLKEIEPAITGKKAIHMPHETIVDYGRICAALLSDIEAKDGLVRLGEEVTAIRRGPRERGAQAIEVETPCGRYAAGRVINCAGLQADRVARAAGANPDVRIVPFRGEYYTLSPRVAHDVHGLVYPVPDPQFPFLGVHLTPFLDGRMTAGPNAVLALAREGYRWTDINLRDLASTFAWPGFWRMARQHWKMAAWEMQRSLSKKVFAESVRKFLPDCRPDDLLPGGAGVRAQAIGRDGRIVTDFLFVEDGPITHVLNAPSPAATASLSIARRIIDLAEKRA